jgi:hypothetical protein
LTREAADDGDPFLGAPPDLPNPDAAADPPPSHDFDPPAFPGAAGAHDALQLTSNILIASMLSLIISNTPELWNNRETISVWPTSTWVMHKCNEIPGSVYFKNNDGICALATSSFNGTVRTVNRSKFEKEYGKAANRFVGYNEFVTFEKDDNIVLCFRGSRTTDDWLDSNVDITFNNLSESARLIRTHLVIKDLKEAGKLDKSVKITGHSLGGFCALYALASPVFVTVERSAEGLINSCTVNLPDRLAVYTYDPPCVPCDKGFKWIRQHLGSGGSNCETSEFDIVLKNIIEKMAEINQSADGGEVIHDLKIFRTATDPLSVYCERRNYLTENDSIHSFMKEILLPEGVQLAFPQRRYAHDLDLFIVP